MKKNILLLISVFFTISLFSGCMTTKRQPTIAGKNQTIGSKTGLTTTPPNAAPRYYDGTYKVSYNKPDPRGWTDFVIIKIARGRIANVVYDSVFSKNKHLKSRDASYAAAMKAKVKITPADYQRRLAQQLVNTQDITKVDYVSGAAESSQDFIKLAQVALNNAKKGYPKKTVVPSGK